jgi:hypothetical protein
MAVGFPTKTSFVNGDVYSAADVNDLAGTVNLLDSAQYAAGKNKVLNGDFNIWQRGTSFTASGYTADRWYFTRNNTTTLSQQTFTPGTAPVSGYEGTYYMRLARTAGASSDYLLQKIEDVRTFAGQTIKFSYWAKASSAVTLNATYFEQNFGSGGSTTVTTTNSATSLTTSWQRFTVTVAIPSITGKTIGTSSFLAVNFELGSAMGTSITVDIWGVQVEAGSTASAFQTATGTLQGELAACQRYYQQSGANPLWSGNVTSGVTYYMTCQLPVVMRTSPSCTFTITNNNGFPATNPGGSTITAATIWATAVANTTGTGAFFGFTYTASAEL